MKNILTIFTLSIGVAAFSQDAVFSSVDVNNVNATVSNNGILFNRTGLVAPGYETPKGSGLHTLFSMGFWFGGTDINGQLKLSAQTYDPMSDQFPGPLEPMTANAPTSSGEYGVYTVSKDVIETHIASYDDPGYEVPASIADWPVHGSVEEGISYYLAPFIDVNGDGTYNPEFGDYPNIKGDMASYIIMNDRADIHGSGGDPIGLEIHYLIYQYDTDDYLNNTTFINMRVINRSTQTLFDYRTGCFIDPDIGGANDDYVGSISDKNLMYAYNSSNFDTFGYEENPPAMGVKLLNRDAYSIVTFASGAAPAMSMPETPFGYYNYMGALWADGTEMTEGGDGYGGDSTYRYMYDGMPTDTSTWTELGEENTPGDRRLLMSTEDEILGPGQILCFDYAVMYADGGDFLENVETLVEMADNVQDFYNADSSYCEEVFDLLSVSENVEEGESFTVYPNPSNGTFTVNFDGDYQLDLYTLDGRNVFTQKVNAGATTFNVNIQSGTYVAVLTQNEKQYHAKVVIQ